LKLSLHQCDIKASSPCGCIS